MVLVLAFTKYMVVAQRLVSNLQWGSLASIIKVRDGVGRHVHCRNSELIFIFLL